MVTGIVVTGLGAASLIFGATAIALGPHDCAADQSANCRLVSGIGTLFILGGLGGGIGGGVMWAKGAQQVPVRSAADTPQVWVAVGPEGVGVVGQF